MYHGMGAVWGPAEWVHASASLQGQQDANRLLPSHESGGCPPNPQDASRCVEGWRAGAWRWPHSGRLWRPEECPTGVPPSPCIEDAPTHGLVRLGLGGRPVRCARAVRKVGEFLSVFPDGQGGCGDCCVTIHRAAEILTQPQGEPVGDPSPPPSPPFQTPQSFRTRVPPICDFRGKCWRQRRGKFYFGAPRGIFFCVPYVSILKILRIPGRIQEWLKNTKNICDPHPTSGSDLG